MTNLLKNGDFEKEWSQEHGGHNVCVVTDSGVEIRTIGNIFVPPNWGVWFYHDHPQYSQPEVRDAWKSGDPRRVHSGEKAMLLFTFWRNHWAGFMQIVSDLDVGQWLRFSAYTHAWSNWNEGPHPDDPGWSEGSHVGHKVVALREGALGLDDGDRNFVFKVGIDPTGGTNPLADTVIWGQGFHIYNDYCQELSVEAVAKTKTVTVFLQSKTLWTYKHNDAYFDSASLVAIDEPSPPSLPLSNRGQPRVQYERAYALLPPGAGTAWAQAVMEATWDTQRLTVGGSADDAAIGDLNVRKIIAINPSDWPGDLRAFYKTHYPGVDYEPITAISPSELQQKLRGEASPPSPPPPPPSTQPFISFHLQAIEPGVFSSLSRNAQALLCGGAQQAARAVRQLASQQAMYTAHRKYQALLAAATGFVETVQPRVIKIFQAENARKIKAVSPNTLVVLRYFTDRQPLNGDLQQAARNYVASFRDTLVEHAEWIDFVESFNETVCSRNAESIRRAVQFDVYFADELMALGLPVAPGLLNVAVGNPWHQGGEIELLLPAVRQAVRYNGVIGYHAYHLFTAQVSGPAQDWEYFAGRWQEWDKVFVAHGLRPRYVFGECGAFANCNAGWRDPLCCNGDWNLYLAQILEFQRRVAEWNRTHGDRALGGMLFTICPVYMNWSSFRLTEPEMTSLANALTE